MLREVNVNIFNHTLEKSWLSFLNPLWWSTGPNSHNIPAPTVLVEG